MMDLACGDELADCACDVLDGNVGVYPVLIEQVDRVGPQSTQRRVSDGTDLLRSTVQAHAFTVLDVPPELRREDDLVAERLEGFPDELLVDVGAVDLCG